MNAGTIAEYLPAFAAAAGVTLSVSIVGIVGALAVGLAVSVIRFFRVPLLRHVGTAYIELARNTPLIVQLFFIFFGLPKVGIVLSATTSAMLGLMFLGGAYMAEAFRSGLEAVGRSQWESSASLGFTTRGILRYVVLPQAFARSLPALAANVVFLVKETSVVSVLALPDLVFVAKQVIGRDYNTSEALVLLVGFYLLILLPVSLGAAAIERRVRHAEFGV